MSPTLVLALAAGMAAVPAIARDPGPGAGEGPVLVASSSPAVPAAPPSHAAQASPASATVTLATSAPAVLVAPVTPALATSAPAVLVAPATPALATSAPAPPTMTYWGRLPPPVPGAVGRFENHKRSAWEYPVNLPYWLVAWPLRVVGEGIGYTVVGANKIGLIAPGRPRLFPVRVGQTEIRIPSVFYNTIDGLGVSLPVAYVSDGRDRALLKLGVSTKGKNKATFGTSVPFSDEQGLGFGVGYRTRQSAKFWGIGPDSQDDTQALYAWETSWAGISYYHASFPQETGLQLVANWTSAFAHGSDEDDEDHPPLGEFAPLLPGFGDRSQGVTFALHLRHDNTTELGRPMRGGVRRGKVAWFRDTTGRDVEFMAYRAELQQFVPLWFDKRVLALRGITSFLDKTGDDPIPFQRLLTNDEADIFRGYPDERWRDRGLLLFNFEYRWPVWADKSADDIGVDTVLFFDWGQVFEDVQDITMQRMTRSYGIGFRGAVFGRYLGALEFGFSEEGFQFRLTTQQIFQTTSASLFQGANPVPER